MVVRDTTAGVEWWLEIYSKRRVVVRDTSTASVEWWLEILQQA